MTIDKEFVTTILTIIGATAAVMSKMVTKEDLKDIFAKIDKVDTKIDSLRTEVAIELRAVRSDINTITKMYGEHGERIARVEERPR